MLAATLAWAAPLATVVTAAALLPATAAQAQRHPPSKVKVEGTVKRDGTPVANARVFLKDPKTLVVRTYVSTDAGFFHFNNLQPSNDFDLWAELEGRRSKTRHISQFSSKTTFNYTLTLK